MNIHLTEETALARLGPLADVARTRVAWTAKDSMEVLEPELLTLHKAGLTMAANSPVALRASLVLAHLYEDRRPARQSVELLTAAINHARQADSADLADALTARATAYLALGRANEGRADLIQALSLAGQDKRRVAMAKSRLGTALRLQGRLQQARTAHFAARDAFEPNDHCELSRVHHQLGVLYRYEGCITAAIAELVIAFEHARTSQDPWVICRAHLQLGICHQYGGDPQTALSHLREAVRLADAGCWERRVESYGFFGRIQHERAEFQAAEASYTLALTLARQSEANLAAAYVHLSLAFLSFELDDLETTLNHATLAAQLGRDHDIARVEGLSYALLGAAHARQGNLDAAYANFARSNTGRDIGDSNKQLAVGVLRAELDIARAAGSPPDQAQALKRVAAARINAALTPNRQTQAPPHASCDDIRFALRAIEPVLRRARMKGEADRVQAALLAVTVR